MKRGTLWTSMLIEVIGPKQPEVPKKIRGMRLATFWERFLESVAIHADQERKRCSRLASQGNDTHKILKRFRLEFDELTIRQLRKRRMGEGSKRK